MFQLFFAVTWGLELLAGPAPQPSGAPPPVATLIKQVASAPPWEQVVLLRGALRQYPDHPHLLLLLGGALLFEGEWEKAREVLGRAVAQAPAEGRYLRGAAQLRLAILDGHFPNTRERARTRVEALLAGDHLTHGDRQRARLTLVRLLGAAMQLAEAEEQLGRVEAAHTGVEVEIQEMVWAERLLLHLRRLELEQAADLLPRLAASRNRTAWWTGVLARLYLDRTQQLEELLADVEDRQLPGAYRLLAQALRRGMAGESWDEILTQHREGHPWDPSTPLVEAWLARRQGNLNWRAYLRAGVDRLGPGLWVAPPWSREEP